MPVVSADVPEEMEEEIETHRQGEESRSAAVRRILRWGLDRADPEQNRRPITLAGIVAGIAYIASYIFADGTALSVIGGAYIAATLGWSMWPHLQ